MAALDTANKRHAIMTQVGRLQFGLVADGAVDMDDCQNYAWIYPFLTYPAPSEGVEEMYERSIDCSVGCKL